MSLTIGVNRTGLLLTAFVIVVAFFSGGDAHGQVLFRTTDRLTGIEIIVGSEVGMFPSAWTDPQVRATAVSPSPAEIQRSVLIVKTELARYDRKLIRLNLKRIYVVGSMGFYGLPYGGTNSSDALYIANQGIEQGYTNDYLRRTFHHEFSSILYRNYARFFDSPLFRSANPSWFNYRGSGTQAVATNKDDTRENGKLIPYGFFSEYSMASEEEDLNVIAENLLAGGKQIFLAAKKSPRMARKVDVLISFYSKIDPALGSLLAQARR